MPTSPLSSVGSFKEYFWLYSITYVVTNELIPLPPLNSLLFTEKLVEKNWLYCLYFVSAYNTFSSTLIPSDALVFDLILNVFIAYH